MKIGIGTGIALAAVAWFAWDMARKRAARKAVQELGEQALAELGGLDPSAAAAAALQAAQELAGAAGQEAPLLVDAPLLAPPKVFGQGTKVIRIVTEAGQ